MWMEIPYCGTLGIRGNRNFPINDQKCNIYIRPEDSGGKGTLSLGQHSLFSFSVLAYFLSFFLCLSFFIMCTHVSRAIARKLSHLALTLSRSTWKEKKIERT